MIWFLIGCAGVALIVFLKSLYDRLCLEKRCTSVVPGHFLYPEWRGKLNGRSVEGCWDPVYEYTVDNVVYMVELDIMYNTNEFGGADVEVRYLPTDPGVCYINGTRGRIRSKKEQSLGGDDHETVR